MKELLEEYVLEAQQLRANAEFLARLVSVMHTDLNDLVDDEGYMPVTVEELQKVTILDIKIENEIVTVG